MLGRFGLSYHRGGLILGAATALATKSLKQVLKDRDLTRGLMHEAALKADEDPDRLSFVHAVHVVQRRMARYGAIPPSAEKSSTRSDPRRDS